MKTVKTFVGKHYLPLDNSYCQNLSNPKGRTHLAGSRGEKSEPVTIKTEPFRMWIDNRISGWKEYTFILVESNDLEVHLILFNEFRVFDSKQELEYLHKRDLENATL